MTDCSCINRSDCKVVVAGYLPLSLSKLTANNTDSRLHGCNKMTTFKSQKQPPYIQMVNFSTGRHLGKHARRLIASGRNLHSPLRRYPTLKAVYRSRTMRPTAVPSRRLPLLHCSQTARRRDGSTGRAASTNRNSESWGYHANERAEKNQLSESKLLSLTSSVSNSSSF